MDIMAPKKAIIMCSDGEIFPVITIRPRNIAPTSNKIDIKLKTINCFPLPINNICEKDNEKKIISYEDFTSKRCSTQTHFK
jgi:hypothetical protein